MGKSSSPPAPRLRKAVSEDLRRGSDKGPARIDRRKVQRRPSLQLAAMLEDELENSFRKLPDEEPSFLWNSKSSLSRSSSSLLTSCSSDHSTSSWITKMLEEEEEEEDVDPVELHHQRMKKLDRKLAKFHQQIAQLQQALQQSDEKRQVQVQRCQDREQKARYELEHLQEEIEWGDDTQDTEYEQFLRAQLEANFRLIGALRMENKQLHRELHKQEKQMDKIRFSTIQLDKFHVDLNESLKLKELALHESLHLTELVEEDAQELEANQQALAALQAKYLDTARQRSLFQTTLAEMLTHIQNSPHMIYANAKLHKACFKVATKADTRTKNLMERLEELIATTGVTTSNNLDSSGSTTLLKKLVDKDDDDESESPADEDDKDAMDMLRIQNHVASLEQFLEQFESGED